MSANIFGQQMHDNCCVMVKGRRQSWRWAVIKYQQKTFFAPYRYHLRNRKYLELGIWQCLTILGTRALIHSLSKTLRVSRIDETDLNALVGTIILGQTLGANIEIVELKILSADMRKILHGKG